MTRPLLLVLIALLTACATTPNRAPAPTAVPLRVMSFNLRYDNAGHGPNAWPLRKAWVAQLIRFHDADAVGVQEALHGMLADLDTLLQNPHLPSADAWTLRASRGFEGMAMSVDGKTLYPILEGALRDDPDARRRLVYEFDGEARRYTGRTWQYRVDAAFPDAVIGDFTAVDQHRLVLDLLRIADPAGISRPARPGEFGVGDPFSFPLQSVESVALLRGERLLIANDNNYPFSDGRWVGRDRPDDTELIVVRAPALR